MEDSDLIDDFTGMSVRDKHRAILNTIREQAGCQVAYRRLWDTIQEYGEDSDQVESFLDQFNDCTDDIDFTLRYQPGSGI